MLSYQHLYHAGNLADLHKHAVLAHVLAYMTRKDKPLSYIETHSGRGLYDLAAPEAVRTGEAAKGIEAHGDWVADQPLGAALAEVRATRGPRAYPGSPLIARSLLRPGDRLHLAELHPKEHDILRDALRAPNVRCYRQDGFSLALSLCPPDPRRGVLLVDPSWEIKTDYTTVPGFLARVHRIWNVGVLMLWYPVLEGGPHVPMLRALRAELPESLVSEVRFPPARDGHRMVGSGMVVVNGPWDLAQTLAPLEARFAAL